MSLWLEKDNPLAREERKQEDCVDTQGCEIGRAPKITNSTRRLITPDTLCREAVHVQALDVTMWPIVGGVPSSSPDEQLDGMDGQSPNVVPPPLPREEVSQQRRATGLPTT